MITTLLHNLCLFVLPNDLFIPFSVFFTFLNITTIALHWFAFVWYVLPIYFQLLCLVSMCIGNYIYFGFAFLAQIYYILPFNERIQSIDT